jgi:hypothetical protein
MKSPCSPNLWSADWHSFFKGLLKYYGIEYLNLNPNGIFHVSVFVHFCEAFVGIKPHWILFRKFFCLKP